MPPTYYVHPEFGYFCPGPRARRELRVAVVSILAGMAIGATIMAIHAGQAAETDAVSGHAKLKSSAPEPLAAVPAASPRIMGAEADLVEAIKPYPIRMVRVRSSKAPSPLAGIPFGRTEPPERPVSAGPASPENAEAPASPAALLRAQSVAAAEPAVSGTKKRPSAMHARRQRDNENENARRQNRRWPYWGERAYAEDRDWRGAYRNWLY